MVSGLPVGSQAEFSNRVNLFAFNAVLRYSTAKGSALALLLVLAKFADDDGECWPALATLAALTHMTERGTQMNLRKLVVSGELTIVNRPWQSNQYRIAVAGAKSSAPGEKPNTRRVKAPSPELGEIRNQECSPIPPVPKTLQERECAPVLKVEETPGKPEPHVTLEGFVFTVEQAATLQRKRGAALPLVLSSIADYAARGKTVHSVFHAALVWQPPTPQPQPQVPTKGKTSGERYESRPKYESRGERSERLFAEFAASFARGTR